MCVCVSLHVCVCVSMHVCVCVCVCARVCVAHTCFRPTDASLLSQEYI